MWYPQSAGAGWLVPHPGESQGPSGAGGQPSRPAGAITGEVSWQSACSRMAGSRVGVLVPRMHACMWPMLACDLGRHVPGKPGTSWRSHAGQRLTDCLVRFSSPAAAAGVECRGRPLQAHHGGNSSGAEQRGAHRQLEPTWQRSEGRHGPAEPGALMRLRHAPSSQRYTAVAGGATWATCRLLFCTQAASACCRP